MAWRTAHGNARSHGALVVIETLPADELPPASPADPARHDRDAAGRFMPGNSLAKNAKFRAGNQGALARLEAKGDAAWQAADRWSRRFAAFRRGELTRAHGGELSSEVCSLVEHERQALADARWARAKAAELDATDPGRAERLRSEARQLRIEARGHGMAAWELAAREAQARPRLTGLDRLDAEYEADMAAQRALPPKTPEPEGEETP